MASSSRFAILRVEDDDEWKTVKKAEQQKSQLANSKSNAQKLELEKAKAIAAKKAAQKQQKKQEKAQVNIYFFNRMI